MVNKVIVDQAKASSLRKKIEENTNTKIDIGTPIYEFIEDLIRMAQMVEDPEIKDILLNPFAEDENRGPEWKENLRKHLKKLISLSKDGSDLNEYQLQDLHLLIEIVINKRMDQMKHMRVRTFDMVTIAPSDITDELNRVKKFLETFYPKSKGRSTL